MIDYFWKQGHFSLTCIDCSLGQPGVECHIQHESGAAVRDLIFLINEVRTNRHQYSGFEVFNGVISNAAVILDTSLIFIMLIIL